ncbi:McrB family protein [Rossellomorea sp. LjRoot5]|uniref:McrB family protein n=1 Tax=Rossellomorea sp. LjRoot5 TaxID=3342331 RepID=UPI003ECF86CC
MSLQTHLQNSRLLFNQENVIDLYLSLKTSPITIFTGISGSGKTKLAQLFTEYMVTTLHPVTIAGTPMPSPVIERQRFSFVSVRPDWLDNKGVLGYYNPLLGVYSITPILQLLLNALNEPNEPHFLVLDEMNLAKAEYYFSDFLSALESRRYSPTTGSYEAESINLHNAGSRVIAKNYADPNDKIQAIAEMNSLPDNLYVHVSSTLERKYFIPESIVIPPNLYVIGTINIDESTYRFSPKIIDRAHVIEMNGTTTEDYINYLTGTISTITTHSSFSGLDFNKRDFTHGNRFISTRTEAIILSDTSINQNILQETVTHLGGLLLDSPFRFSYRTTNRLIQFIGNGKDLWDNSHIPFNDDSLLFLLDSAILLKVLPRLHGQRRLLEPLLKNLIYFCRSTFTNAHYVEIISGRIPDDLKGLESQPFVKSDYRYPRAALTIFKVYNSLVKGNANYGSFI